LKRHAETKPAEAGPVVRAQPLWPAQTGYGLAPRSFKGGRKRRFSGAQRKMNPG
jgi:hypothetical protein